MLATAAAYERAVDTYDKTAFHNACRALQAFRRQIADYDRSYFAGLTGDEKVWEQEDQ